MNKLSRLFCRRRTRCAAVIVAAGRSSRMQGMDKILCDLGSKPLIWHTIQIFQTCSAVKEIVIVTREDLIPQIREICRDSNFDKVTAVVAGGDTRTESVMNGLDHVSKDTTIAAIHDGARPFVTHEIIERTLEKTQRYHAAAPAIAVKDTIKVAQNHIVTQTPERSSLFAVQTPQMFDYDLLRGALTNALTKGIAVTDDCSAVEAIGMSVYLTQGSDENIKITTPTDLILAQAIYEGRERT